MVEDAVICICRILMVLKDERNKRGNQALNSQIGFIRRDIRKWIHPEGIVLSQIIWTARLVIYNSTGNLHFPSLH